MSKRVVWIVWICVFLVSGCAQSGDETEAVGAETAWTGALSEEDFKALHEHKGEKAPPSRGQMIEIAGSRAYLSLPDGGKAPLPALVVIHEWWGLNDNIKHWADRMAADGYAALAVDLYGGEAATTPEKAMSLMKAVDPDRAREILVAGHEFLAKDTRIGATRRGSIGWCFGGGQSLQLALAAPDLDACVIYYGFVDTDPKVLAKIGANVLGVFANQDRSITTELVDQFETALGTAKVKHEILRFDADHAFANPSSARYDPESASAAWDRVRAFLATTLKETSAAKR